MGELSARLDDLETSIQGFIAEVTGLVESVKSEFQTLGGGVLAELQTIPPELQAAQQEVDAQCTQLEQQIDTFTS